MKNVCIFVLVIYFRSFVTFVSTVWRIECHSQPVTTALPTLTLVVIHFTTLNANEKRFTEWTNRIWERDRFEMREEEREEITWWVFNWFKIDNFLVWSAHLSMAESLHRSVRSGNNVSLRKDFDVRLCYTQFLFMREFTRKGKAECLQCHTFLLKYYSIGNSSPDMITTEDRTTWSHWWPNTTTYISKIRIRSIALRNTLFVDILQRNG